MADIGSLKKQLLRSLLKESFLSDPCPICYCDDVEPVYVDACSHAFCMDCIQQSQANNKKCPVCGVNFQCVRTLDQQVGYLCSLMTMPEENVSRLTTIRPEIRSGVNNLRKQTNAEVLQKYCQNVKFWISLFNVALSEQHKLLLEGIQDTPEIIEFISGLSEESTNLILEHMKTIRQYKAGELIEILFGTRVSDMVQPFLANLPEKEETTALLLRKCKKINGEGQPILFGEFLCLSQTVNRFTNDEMNLFFTHYYNRQWRDIVARFNEKDKDIWDNIHLHEDETITEKKELENGETAIRVAEYSKDGRKVLYDGFWLKHQYCDHGKLYEADSVTECNLRAAETRRRMKGDDKDAERIDVKETRALLARYLMATGTKNMDTYMNDRNEIQRIEPTSIFMYDGMFKDGKKCGHGVETNMEGIVVYDGDFAEGKRNGHGVEYYTNGNIMYDGEYKEGERHGENCKFYRANGALDYVGIYEHNVPFREGLKYVSPTYCFEVKKYGEENTNEKEIWYYHDVEDCQFETDDAWNTQSYRHIGEPVDLFGYECTYCLTLDKAYIYVEDIVFDGILDMLRFYDESRALEKSRKARTVVFHGDPSVPYTKKERRLKMSDCFTILLKDQDLQELYFNSTSIIDDVLDSEKRLGIVLLSYRNCMFDNPNLLFDTTRFDLLKELSIVRCSCQRIEFTSDHLKYLQKLTLDQLPSLTSLVVGDQALMSLELLRLNDFHALQSVSFGADSLQKAFIAISNCPKLVDLKLANGCGRIATHFVLKNCDVLESLIFNPMSFRKCSSLVLSGNGCLKSITIGKGCFITMKSIEIRDCRSLQTFHFAKTTVKPSLCNIDPCLADQVFRAIQQWIHLDFY